MAANQFSGLLAAGIDLNALVSEEMKGVANPALVPGFNPLIAKVNRNERGQFSNLQGAVLDAHRAMTAQISRAIIKRLREKVDANGRRQRPERKLFYALSAQDGRFSKVSLNGFVAARTDFLDSNASGVKFYWRNLETGSSVHVGRKAAGFFFGRDGSLSGPDPDRRDGGPLIRSGSNRQAAKAFKAKKSGIPSFTIKNPIPAYRYISNGYRDWEASDGTKAGLRATYESTFKDHGFTFAGSFIKSTGRRF